MARQEQSPCPTAPPNIRDKPRFVGAIAGQARNDVARPACGRPRPSMPTSRRDMEYKRRNYHGLSFHPPSVILSLAKDLTPLANPFFASNW